MESKTVLAAIIERAEEWNSLNVVPMEVGYEDMGIDRAIFKFTAKLLPQNTKSSATVENENIVAATDLDAGGVTPITQIFGLGSWRRAAHAPELNSHGLLMPS